VGRSIQWLLGDWITYGNAKFGERYAKASRITGYDSQTLMNMVYVASRFSISRRRESLSWSHHEALAATAVDEQELWLDRAVTHGWSVTDLRTMLRAERRKGDADHLCDSSADRPLALASGPDAEPAAPQSGGAEHGPVGPGGKRKAPGAKVTCPRCGEEVSLRAENEPART
jgi:hypothetical protein